MLVVMTEREPKGGYGVEAGVGGGTGNVLFLHWGAHCTDTFSLWKFMKPYAIQDTSMKTSKTHTHSTRDYKDNLHSFLKSWLVVKKCFKTLA